MNDATTDNKTESELTQSKSIESTTMVSNKQDTLDQVDQQIDRAEETSEIFSINDPAYTSQIDQAENNESLTLDNLDFTLKWDLGQVKKILNWLFEHYHDLEEQESEHQVSKLLYFYQKLRSSNNNQKNLGLTTLSKSNKNQLAGDLVQLRIASIYAKFIQEKISKTEPISFLNFLSNRYLDERAVINHYFDKIYVLNLDRRPDRMQNMVRRLKRWGIYNYVRFPAVDGTQSPHWEEWKHYTKSRLTRIEKLKYHRKAIASAGSWAILKSMYHLLKDAQKNEYGRILVLQDDILFHKRFAEEFMKVPSYIPDKKWKLLFLGATQHNWTHIMKSKHYYYPNGTADGAFAVGIHSRIYDEMIEEILKFEMPVDSGALRNLQKKHMYSSYVLYPNLLIADIRDSDLRHSRDLSNFGKRFHWDVNLYEIDN